MINAQILHRHAVLLGLLGTVLLLVAPAGQVWSQAAKPELIAFKSGDLELKGFVWKPDGPGPFPAIL